MANDLIDTITTLEGRLSIEIWSEDFRHAVEGHPEVTLKKIKEALEHPLKVIQSKSSNSVCLFYSVEIKIGKTESFYFCVVVAVTGNTRGKMITAYETDFIKTGKILFLREPKK